MPQTSHERFLNQIERSPGLNQILDSASNLNDVLRGYTDQELESKIAKTALRDPEVGADGIEQRVHNIRAFIAAIDRAVEKQQD